MEYKAAELTLVNFKGSTKLKIKFNGNVTFLIGVNGSGKTMIGTAFQYLFEGKTFFNNKYRRRMITDGEDKLKVIGEFTNEETGKSFKITRTLTSNDSPNLKVECDDNDSLDMKEILSMINILYLRPFEIVKMTPQEQAKLVGVDTTDYDKKIKEMKSNLTVPRSDLKRVKDKLKEYVVDPMKIDKVILKDLYEERDNIREFNQEQLNRNSEITSQTFSMQSQNQKIKKLEEELEFEKNSLTTMEDILESLDKPEPTQSLDNVKAKIENADATNTKATTYNTWIELNEDLKTKKVRFAFKQQDVKDAEQNKIDYIKSTKVDPSVTFDEDGGLRLTAFGHTEAYLNEAFFSTGQILKLSIQFCLIKMLKDRANNLPTIPVIFVDNAEGLDKKNLEYIDKISKEYNIQFILGYQGDEPQDGRNCVMLSEQSITKITKEAK